MILPPRGQADWAYFFIHFESWSQGKDPDLRVWGHPAIWVRKKEMNTKKNTLLLARPLMPCSFLVQGSRGGGGVAWCPALSSIVKIGHEKRKRDEKERRKEENFVGSQRLREKSIEPPLS